MKIKNAEVVEKIVSELKVKEIDDNSGELIIEGFANTVSKDRAGDVIPSSAWEGEALKDYLKNPIILAYHDHKMPIGNMVEYSVEPMGLRVKAKISKGAGDVYDLVKDGVLRTFSVGFRIKDANYDSDSDTFFITEVELTEISVVSVPCNQDSVFTISKGLKESLKKQFIKEEIPTMPKETNLDNTPSVEELVQQELAKREQAAREKAAKEKAEKEARDEAIKEAKEAAKAEAEANAKALRDELVKTLAEDKQAFQDLVKSNEETIQSLKDELSQVTASRNDLATAVKTGLGQNVTNEEVAKQADAAVIIASVKGVDIDKTDYFGSIKAVNASSSIQVSSDAYETIFSTNLIRDIQAQLVVAPLFTEMTMEAASMTIPVNPGRSNANWVAAAALADGSNSARTGNEISVALTERTMKTFKLAAKTYLTEETQEDTILSLVPILRQHLVEAHVNEMDRAFLVGDGSGKPAGLVTQATNAGVVETTTAKADGSVKVTALMLAQARRRLDLYGINTNELRIIISQDAYWDLILDPEWADVQQVTASNATKLTGEVGNVYGMPVIVSNQFAAKAVSTAFGVIVNTKNFVVPRQRGVTLRTDFDVELDRRVFVATQRVNLEAYFEGKGVVALTYAAT
jgi:HK97 family phage prohead protease/HK97 family phage major capsid protein